MFAGDEPLAEDNAKRRKGIWQQKQESRKKPVLTNR